MGPSRLPRKLLRDLKKSDPDGDRFLVDLDGDLDDGDLDDLDDGDLDDLDDGDLDDPDGDDPDDDDPDDDDPDDDDLDDDDGDESPYGRFPQHPERHHSVDDNVLLLNGYL